VQAHGRGVGLRLGVDAGLSADNGRAHSNDIRTAHDVGRVDDVEVTDGDRGRDAEAARATRTVLRAGEAVRVAGLDRGINVEVGVPAAHGRRVVDGLAALAVRIAVGAVGALSADVHVQGGRDGQLRADGRGARGRDVAPV